MAGCVGVQPVTSYRALFFIVGSADIVLRVLMIFKQGPCISLLQGALKIV